MLKYKDKSRLDIYNSLIEPHIQLLNAELKRDRKKIVELCHVGKFLMLYGSNLKIETLFEEPDFIIKNNDTLIGLEHQIIINEKEKCNEGMIETLFEQIEIEFQKQKLFPNILINCWLNSNYYIRINEKENLKNEIKKIIETYVTKGFLMKHPLFNDISSMPHSQININANFGCWWQARITEKLVLNAISKKEKKLKEYRKNTDANIAQWLLLVINTSGKSSYSILENLEVNVASDFDKIFILEDLNTSLYEVK